VHKAGIVRKEEIAAGNNRYCLLEVCVSGDVDQGVAGALRHRSRAFPVAGAAEENRLRADVVDQPVGDGGKPFREPFLCRPVGSTRCNTNQRSVLLQARLGDEPLAIPA
jgi:hypothetical protein